LLFEIKQENRPIFIKFEDKNRRFFEKMKLKNGEKEERRGKEW